MARYLRIGVSGIAIASWMIACGARTELYTHDASAPDAKAHDASLDVHGEDVQEEDVLPIADAFPDTPIVTNCVDAGSTLIYVIGDQSDLYSFYPPTLAFQGIGKIACPSSSSPFSMAVDRSGIAYSVFVDGHLFQISTQNAACKGTPFVPEQSGFGVFGMGFAGNADGGESLYVAGVGSVYSKGLAIIDTSSWVLGFIAQFQPLLPRCELSGTGDGRLFGFCIPPFGGGSEVVEIDPATAVVLSAHTVSLGTGNDAFAFAFWGGDFWIFTSTNGGSTVTKYDPIAQTETPVATAPIRIVGAGVSTCAPQ